MVSPACYHCSFQGNGGYGDVKSKDKLFTVSSGQLKRCSLTFSGGCAVCWWNFGKAHPRLRHLDIVCFKLTAFSFICLKMNF